MGMFEQILMKFTTIIPVIAAIQKESIKQFLVSSLFSIQDHLADVKHLLSNYQLKKWKMKMRRNFSYHRFRTKKTNIACIDIIFSTIWC